MNTDDLDRLLWELIDGTIEPGERARLESFLASHPEAAARQREVGELSAALASVVAVEPPPELVPAIERAIANCRPRSAAPSMLALALRALVAPRWPVRLAWAVLGVLLGAAATVILVNGDFGAAGRGDLSRYYGAVHVPEQFGRGHGLVVELPAGVGELSLVREGRVVVLDVVVHSTAPEDLAVTLAVPGAYLEGLQEQGPGASACTVSPSAVLFAAKGATRAAVRIGVPAGEERIRLTVTGEGKTFVDREIVVNGIPEL
ncbi:MAG: hypothetical protein ACM3O7_10210 [Acidobacteriota bacterium]